METIKNTVANVLGTTKSHETDVTTDSTSGHYTHSGATDTFGGHHATSGATGATGTASDATPSYHDQSTGRTGNLSQGATETSATAAGHGVSDTNGKTQETMPNDLSPSKYNPDRKEAQSPDQGPDPALVGDAKEHPKMVGQGAPGSHSAVFGLTPDGKRHDDSSHGTGPVRPAHSRETTLGKKGVADASGIDSGHDTVSGGRGGVSDQIDAPDTGKKGLERTDPAPISESNSGGKPGAGLTGLGQS
jgi:hypothetical protein